jgi:hypothetical protein
MADDRISTFVPPKDDDKLITWAMRRHDDAFKLPEHDAKQNLAFMLGKQWGVWDSSKRRFQNAASTKGDVNAEVRITVNKIAGHVERTIARLTKSMPIPETRPVTDTDADVNAAKVGTRILDHELNARLKLQQRLIELYFWVLPLGWSFFHPRWDPKAGPVVGEDEKGNPLHLGEIALDEVPAFELRIDPNARRFRDARWCIRDVVMSREAVYEQYGKLPDAEDSESSLDEWRELAADTPGDVKASTGQQSKTGKGFVTVHQFWMRPGGRSTPEGLVFTWSGKTILEKPAPFPYAHGELPFVPLNLLPAVGGSPAGRTWVTDMVQIQKDYNDSRSREAMIRRTLTPKILTPVGSIDPNRMTSRVEVITYNPIGNPPSFEMPDGRWMTQFEQGMNRADVEMGERAGQAEVSQGRAASSAPAASIMALQEADETKMAISANELAATIEQLGFQVLMLVKQFWIEERKVRTWSQDGSLEVSQFNGSNLGEHLDVHVSSESGLPKSKSARAQMAVDLWQQQIITDARVFVRMLDLPGTDFLVQQLNIDTRQAEREHGHLLQMEPVEAKVWHNHMAHIAAHDEFRKSEEYEKLDPQQQAWVDGHVAAHYALVMGQLGVPTPPGTPFMGAEAGGNGAQTTNPGGENGQYTDPMTGLPQDPLQVAAGMAPSNLRGSSVQGKGVVGGTGNPGPVPGQSNDSVAAHTGN